MFDYQDRLIVSNVTANGCKLSWGQSKNTGGLPLEYAVEKCVVGSAESWVKQAVTSSNHVSVNDLGSQSNNLKYQQTEDYT